MFPHSALVAILTLALAAAANPLVNIRDTLVTLPIAKRVNLAGSSSLLAHDQARARHLGALAEAKVAGHPLDIVRRVPVTNQAVDYIANVCTLCPVMMSW